MGISPSRVLLFGAQYGTCCPSFGRWPSRLFYGELFISSLRRLLSLEKRVPGWEINSDIVWCTGDATFPRISAIRWAHHQCLSLRPDEALAEFDYHMRKQYSISECESSSSSAEIVVCGALHAARQLGISGTDNVNVCYFGLSAGKHVAESLYV